MKQKAMPADMYVTASGAPPRPPLLGLGIVTVLGGFDSLPSPPSPFGRALRSGHLVFVLPARRDVSGFHLRKRR